MRNFFKKALWGSLALIAIVATGSQFAGATIPAVCGIAGQPSGCTVLSFPILQNDLNNLINKMNSQVFAYLTFLTGTEAGEPQISSGTAWAANQTTATSITSVGPAQAHTTVQEWLIVVDPAGNPRYLPAF